MKWEKVQRILRKKNHTCTEKKMKKNMQILFFYMAEIKKPQKIMKLLKTTTNNEKMK